MNNGKYGHVFNLLRVDQGSDDKKNAWGHTITDNSIIELFSWNKRLYNSFQSFNVLNVGFTYSWKNYKFLIEFKHFSLVDPVLVEFSLKIIRFIKINSSTSNMSKMSLNYFKQLRVSWENNFLRGNLGESEINQDFS